MRGASPLSQWSGADWPQFLVFMFRFQTLANRVVMNADASSIPLLPTHPSSVLYSHVLEHTFSFLAFRDLRRAGLVCRLWNRAVSSMRPIEGVLSEKKLLRLTDASSQMDKHVAEVGTRFRMLAVLMDELRSISIRWTNLRMLNVRIETKLPAGAPLLFPPSLTRLAIKFAADPTEVQSALRTISQLPRIRSVELLDLPGGDAVDLTCFQSCASLEELEVLFDTEEGQPSLAQIAQARVMSHLRVMSFGYLSAATLQAMLQIEDGFAPKWQRVGTIPLHDLSVAILPRLPSLTSLSSVAYRCPLDFLAQMRELRDLTLTLKNNRFPTDQLAAAISHCVQLESLYLSDTALTSADLKLMLHHLPCLKSLALTNATGMHSLQPFVGALCSLTLERLHLFRIDLPGLDAAGMTPIHGLRNLQQLVLCNTASGEPLSKEAQAEFVVPSKLLPQLSHFHYSHQPQAPQ